MGLSSIVESNRPQRQFKFTLASLTGSTDPDTGDIYTGLDRFGRVKDCRWYDTANSVDLDRYEYGYDRVGNRLYRKNVLAHAASKEYDYLYTYDGLNRLKEMERGLLNGTNTAMSTYKFGQCWELDETGNWSQFRQDLYGNGGWSFNQQRTNNTVNEITDIAETAGPSWATPAYDVKGNMTTLPQPDDPTGTYSATYDAWNRLVKLQDGATTVQENEYDGLNRRTIRKTYTSGTLSEKRFYFYTEDWQCIEERVADGSTTPGLLPAKEQHVWGNRYIDECVLRDRDYNNNGTTLEERLYATQDANWNTTMLYKQSSGYKERYTYNPYGEITFLNSSFNPVGGSVHNWQHLFGSYKRDTTTELYLVRNRLYHTDLGTWLSRDPIGYEGGTSLYEYVNSKPTISVDPAGLISIFGQEFVAPWDSRASWGFGDNANAYSNATSGAFTSAGKWAQEHPRTMGAIKTIGGAAELGVGTAAALTPDPTLVTKGLAYTAYLHGLDQCQAGIRQMLYGQPVDSNLTDLTYRGGKSLGLSDSAAGLTAGVVDSMVGAVGSGGSGLVSSPGQVATRVTASSAKQLAAQGVNKGATGALVIPNGLRPDVFHGLSSRAAKAVGRPHDVSESMLEMFKKFGSKYKQKCAEPELYTGAERAGYNPAKLPSGSAVGVRTLTPKHFNEPIGACRGCAPVVDKSGLNDIFRKYRNEQ
ncbi:tRNA(Glu)-specific nuclease WapA precursor [Thalassoglobus neptunius]|uniref:tRNA(Glu)-specific nuclease WapA n=1 Tax=Thalassoglobus neptunius TaxID=1938619 RepID=A0A5C5VP75_9PLAN|nr:RHS repeat-associated core domain-containing protein [Thalassoglobus neptunius]TWT39910.1 tRNA(Glu)-specific nuclease WapA precursor [Thalassoglobus neptunius]